jgi:NADH-quinone oxidoreductase subunit G
MQNTVTSKPAVPVLTLNGRSVELGGERNLLELIRKAGIDLPTFCYHSELSVYGACRLCLVEIEGRGIQASCAVTPEAGLKVRTDTADLREIRRTNIELLLASHHQGCTTCGKSAACRLLELARRLGVDTVRFTARRPPAPLDLTSPALVRDPNKCVLCGDCVRFCHEIQGIGAIDFAHRGSAAAVVPAFNRGLGEVECVHCGQCARVCPTGAIMPRSEEEPVWKALQDPGKTVVAQIAPAVRVALGETLGLAPGEDTTGRLSAAMRRLGFAKVYDTAFTADLTVIEEAEEYLRRRAAGFAGPMFTSCCPAWVRYSELAASDLLPRLSSCRSPQQMFGALARDLLPKQLGVAPENLVVVSIMPCTAKKYEAGRAEFAHNGRRDLDAVLTTQELAHMIQGAGVRFSELVPEPLDMPFACTSGAGLLFGASGGVSEAVLRYAAAKLSGGAAPAANYGAADGTAARREVTVTVNEIRLRLGMVYGLREAQEILKEVRAGTCEYDLIEVMACPGGCVGGAGQPVPAGPETTARRACGLRHAAAAAPLHGAQDNPFITKLYQEHLGEPGGPRAHKLLHTKYQTRRRLGKSDGLPLIHGQDVGRVKVSVCLGTSCHLRGSQKVLRGLAKALEERGLAERVELTGAFCHERCDRGPAVTVNGQVFDHCTAELALAQVEAALAVATGA